MYAFGPVPSRRLGRSLGVNNIPPKVCTYSCVYCQVGRTTRMPLQRQEFYRPQEVARAVQQKLANALKAGETVGYLAFVPDGEPTLDVHLGEEIDLLRPLGIPIAVITNASLLWREDVRAELARADWVSLKVDSVDPQVWRQTDRPHGGLSLTEVLEGMLAFAGAFAGELTTETMLVKGLNDGPESLAGVAEFVSRLQPAKACLSIPTRPPAEPDVQSPDEAAISRAYQIFSSHLKNVEYLIGYEGSAFAFTGDAEADLLSITAVHPMREEAVANLLARAQADWTVVDRLLATGRLVQTEYRGTRFYLRRVRAGQSE